MHPLLILFELEPLALYDTLRKPHPIIAGIRRFVRHIAVHQLFRDAIRERVARQPLVVVEVRTVEAMECDRGHMFRSVGVGDNATAEAM